MAQFTLKGSVDSLEPIPVAEHSNVASLLGLRVRMPPGHGYLSLVNAVYCQVEVSATGRSRVQRGVGPSVVYLPLCGVETSRMRQPSPSRAVAP
jgi:hypothetical protein